MVGLILVSHGRFAPELLRAAEMILGPQDGVHAIGIAPGDDVEALGKQVYDLVQMYCSQHDGAMILTDMFGGSPTNICAPCLGLGSVEVITAMNLPMVMKCLNHRQKLGWEELCTLVVDSGRQGILRVGEKLAGR